MKTNVSISLAAILWMLLMFFALPLLGQNQMAPCNDCNHQLTFIAQEFTAERLNIFYEVPFPGVVELKLYDENGKQVYSGQNLSREGKNKISLNARAFSPGENYSYTLFYKRHVTEYHIYAPLASN